MWLGLQAPLRELGDPPHAALCCVLRALEEGPGRLDGSRRVGAVGTARFAPTFSIRLLAGTRLFLSPRSRIARLNGQDRPEDKATPALRLTPCS